MTAEEPAASREACSTSSRSLSVAIPDSPLTTNPDHRHEKRAEDIESGVGQTALAAAAHQSNPRKKPIPAPRSACPHHLTLIRESLSLSSPSVSSSCLACRLKMTEPTFLSTIRFLAQVR